MKFTIRLFISGVLILFLVPILSAKELEYKISHGICPSKTMSNLAFYLFDTFKQDHSLYDIKKKIVDENLDKRNFIANYKVDYNPRKKLLQFSFNCPRPYFRAIFTDEKGQELKREIFVESRDLYDNEYGKLWLEENSKIKGLPELSIYEKDFDREKRELLAQIVEGAPDYLQGNIAEMFFNKEKELIFVYSINQVPMTVLFGKDEWMIKLQKLKKTTKFLIEKNKIPSIINLTHSKKVIVKF